MDDEYGSYWDDTSTDLEDSNMGNDSYYSMDTDSMGQDLDMTGPKAFSFNNAPDYGNLDGISGLFNTTNQYSLDPNRQQSDFNYFHNTPGVDYEQILKDYVPEGEQSNGIDWMGGLSKVISGMSTPAQNKQPGNLIAGGMDMLSKILGSLGGAKGLFGLGNALFEGQQNKQNSANTNRIVQQQQARQDPFASQRPFYQQQLQQSVTNPYGSAIVSDQLKQMQALQARKDAAAGRRSNTAYGNPALMAEAAKVALQDRNSLMAPAGANINPNQIGLQDLLGASQQDTQGTMSPLMSAIGKILQGNEIQDRQGNASNDSTLGNLLKVLSQMSGG